MHTQIVREAPPARNAVWSPTRLIALRLAVVITVWSTLRMAGFASSYVYFGALKRALGPASNRLFRIDRETIAAVGAFIIRPFTGHRGSSAEVVARFNFSLVYLIAAVALWFAITLIWSVADRRRTNYERLERWLRVYARYMLALVAMVYAIVKVVPTQFGFLTPGELLKPYGQQTGFWVLWNFMAASPLYTVFAGLMELVGALLLFFPSTTLIGGLVLAGALTNVLVMDIGYRIGPAPTIIVGLMLALDAIILAPYVWPLARVLRGEPARLPSEPVSQMRPRRYGLLVKLVVLGLLVWIRVNDGLLQRKTYYGSGHPVYGLFDVDSFVSNGTTVIALADDGSTWKRVASDGRYDSAGLSVQFASGDVRQYRLADDVPKQEWTITEASKEIARLHYAVESDASVTLDGRIGDDQVRLHLKPVDIQKLPLFRPR